MKVNGRIRGNLGQPLVVKPDFVYVHTNIEQIEENLFEYDETVYTIEEYSLIEFEQTELNRNQTEVNTANIDYIAIMADIDLEG